MNEQIIVYWSPAVIGWEMLYEEPKSVYSELKQKANKANTSSNMFACPASNDVLQNTYLIKSTIDDHYDLPVNYLNELESNEYVERTVLPVNKNKLSFVVPRKSSLDGYWDIEYNLHWLFFAEEPLKLKITPPYFPPVSPTNGAFLTTGQMDIGQWFRNVNANYYVPKTATSLDFKVGDPLMYLEFITNKKIVFKRFQMTPTLESIAAESAESPHRYGKHMSLSKRYEMGKKSQLKQRVLTEIKKNIVVDSF